MRKYIKLTSVLLLSLLFILGCSSTDDNSTETKDENETEVQETETEEQETQEVEEQANEDETADEGYQRILAEYTIKIQEATPGLINEYNEEAKANTDGLEGLAELSNDKILILAEINNDGVEEMAEIMLTKGSGSYDEYESYAMELMDVYMDEGAKITDAYMDSAMQ